uniref:L-xylulose reductase-like n=1 Tax=Callorhinchus milii TaxID=7868 RepID=A0A4W3GBN0_CALMI
MQIVARGLRARGVGGSIVNISSQASQCALRDHTVYCATKGALDMLTKMMALELGPYNVSIETHRSPLRTSPQCWGKGGVVNQPHCSTTSRGCLLIPLTTPS